MLFLCLLSIFQYPVLRSELKSIQNQFLTDRHVTRCGSCNMCCEKWGNALFSPSTHTCTTPRHVIYVQWPNFPHADLACLVGSVIVWWRWHTLLSNQNGTFSELFSFRAAHVCIAAGVELSMHRCRCELWVWVDEALRKCGSFDECNLQAISEWGRVGDRSALPWLAVARASHSIHTTLSSLTEYFQEIYQIITICTQIPKELNDVKLIILIKFVYYSYI